MKFLADEGIVKKLVIKLRNLGYDVEYAAETLSGFMDNALMEHAWKNGQVILTKDKDFGELVFKEQLKTNGVILIRLENLVTVDRVALVVNWFERMNWDFEMKYITITQNQARVMDLD